MCAVHMSAQNLLSDAYFTRLNSNLSVLYPDDSVVTGYCETYQNNINELFFHDNSIKIGGEEYSQTEKSLEYYNAFQGLNYKSKCRLLYAWAKIRTQINYETESLNMPSQIAYLPVVISAFDNYYSDQCGAFGLWGLQYMPAVRYGIVADTCYDERLDLQKSSFAAVSYLNYLHTSFGSWDYAITAYVYGPAKLRKAMSGEYRFEDVVEKIEGTAKNTFYIYLALLRWMEENETLNPAEILAGDRPLCDTVIVNRKMHFAQIATVLNIDLDSLMALNPLFTGKLIDGRQNSKTIFLPVDYAGNFIKLQDSICHFNDSIYFPKYKPLQKTAADDLPVYYESYSAVSPGEDYEEIKYKIVSGDNLGSIAERYHVKVADIKDWNNISGTNIYAGQKISIWVEKGTAENFIAKAEPPKNNAGTSSVKTETVKKETTTTVKKGFEPKEYTVVDTYIVKSGDSAYKIAQQYSWVTPEDLLNWNNVSDPSKLQVGQKLKIYKKK